MFFVGIDLGRSKKHPSGIAVLEADKEKAISLSLHLYHNQTELMNFINKTLKDENALIAINSPLIIPNEQGGRKVEQVFSRVYGKYDAAIYFSNRNNLNKDGEILGEALSRSLIDNNFQHLAVLEQFEKSRQFFEVYHHSAMIALFNLEKTIKYKKAKNRSTEQKWKGFEQYCELLKNALGEKVSKDQKDLNQRVKGLRGQALKNLEDRLDAAMCAYIAYSYWKNPANCEIVGNIKDGYILTPVNEEIRKELMNAKKEIFN